jgi:hypothetical protein
VRRLWRCGRERCGHNIRMEFANQAQHQRQLDQTTTNYLVVYKKGSQVNFHFLI